MSAVTLVTSSLHPDHLADLRRSGLADETIEAAGIRSVPPTDWTRVLGASLAGSITSAMLIPYGDGFDRVKLCPPVSTTIGSKRRYHQPPGSRHVSTSRLVCALRS